MGVNARELASQECFGESEALCILLGGEDVVLDTAQFDARTDGQRKPLVGELVCGPSGHGFQRPCPELDAHDTTAPRQLPRESAGHHADHVAATRLEYQMRAGIG